MTADITVRPEAVRSVRRRMPVFGLSWRILGLVVVAVMTAEVLIFLPSIARFRMVYLSERIESGTLAALALDRGGSVCLNSLRLWISGFLRGFSRRFDALLGCDGGRA